MVSLSGGYLKPAYAHSAQALIIIRKHAHYFVPSKLCTFAIEMYIADTRLKEVANIP